MLIECPRLLFPFAREIIATAVRNGGFPPLLLDPVDFVALYRQNMAQMQPTPAPMTQSWLSHFAWPVIPPQHILAKARHEFAMRRAFGVAEAWRQFFGPRAYDGHAVDSIDAALTAFGKAELRLPRADQFEIDLGQDFRVEQRAVLGAARIVDAVARAQRVEAVWARPNACAAPASACRPAARARSARARRA